MSIKEVMTIGTSGMTTAQKQEEQEHRIKVCERINLLQVRILGCEKAVKGCENGSKAAKELNYRIKQYNREMNRIKGEESHWLKEAAWFMYA